MNLSRFLFVVLVLVLFVGFAFAPVKAGGMGNGAAQRMKLVVDSVDVAGGSVMIKSGVDGSVHTYKVAATTKIGVRNAKGSLDQITAGMKVVNLKAVPGAEPQTLDVLTVWPAAPAQ